MWRELYEQAVDSADAAAGYYNRNVGLPTPEGKVNVRIPIAAADTMDVRLWQEEDVLACIRPYVGRVPELRHVSRTPRFQVHHFIAGRVLDGFSPRGAEVPPHVMDDVVTLMEQLTRIPREKAPALPAHWPGPGTARDSGACWPTSPNRSTPRTWRSTGRPSTCSASPRTPSPWSGPSGAGSRPGRSCSCTRTCTART